MADDGDDGEFVPAGAKAPVVSAEEHERLVTSAVRLLLLSDHAKRPLRREDLSRKLLASDAGYEQRGKHRGLVTSVLAAARTRLRDVFGLDVAELRAAAAPSGKKPAKKVTASSSSQVSYALVNALPPPPPAPPVDAHAAARIALLTATLTTIVLAGGVLPEDALLTQLAKLGADTVFGDVRALLRDTFCTQQRYLARRKSDSAASAAADGAAAWEYELGPRALAEFGRRQALDFAARVFGLQHLDAALADAILASQGIAPPQQQQQQQQQQQEEEAARQ